MKDLQRIRQIEDQVRLIRFQRKVITLLVFKVIILYAVLGFVVSAKGQLLYEQEIDEFCEGKTCRKTWGFIWVTQDSTLIIWNKGSVAVHKVGKIFSHRGKKHFDVQTEDCNVWLITDSHWANFIAYNGNGQYTCRYRFKKKE